MDCKSVPYLPDFSVNLNGFSLILKSHEYIFTKDNQCHLGFSGKNGDDEILILGNIFNIHFYTIFDMDNHRIGFSEAF